MSQQDISIPDVDVTTFVLEQVDSHADKPALVDGPSGRTITYADLRDQIRAFCNGLAGRGFGKGDVLGDLHAERARVRDRLPRRRLGRGHGDHGQSALHGRTSWATSCATPGRDSCSPCRRSSSSAQAAAEALGGRGGVRARRGRGRDRRSPSCSACGERRPTIDDRPAARTSPSCRTRAGRPGLPKGVMLTHRNLVANLVQTRRRCRSTSDDILIGVLPFFHIYGMTVIMNLGLRSGATIVTMPRFDLEQFLEPHRAARRDAAATSCRRSCSPSRSTPRSTGATSRSLRADHVGRGAARAPS